MPPKPDPASAPRSRALLRWIDTSAGSGAADPAGDDRIDWLRALPFVGLHLACLGVFWVGVSATALQFTEVDLVPRSLSGEDDEIVVDDGRAGAAPTPATAADTVSGIW